MSITFFTPTRNFPSLMYEWKKVFHPSWFQGSRRRKNYFEGWYLKSVSEDGGFSMVFIPGISMTSEDSHAFVQAIDGKTGRTWYFRYRLEEFSYSNQGFEVNVGPNLFSDERMVLYLRDEGDFFEGEFVFSGVKFFPVSLLQPGIMGWYRYVPFMECYHGVVSLDHYVDGTLTTAEGTHTLVRGRGYIEKDWGTSMPRSWVWMQSNHFETPGTSFMLSIAEIPWLGNTFTGFLGFFLHEGKLHRFATYTGAKISHLQYAENSVEVALRTSSLRIIVRGMSGKKGELAAPLLGAMDRIIHESVDASLQLDVFDRKGRHIFGGRGENAGLELTGKLIF